jgi:LPS-assembly lipoprotein
MPTHARKRRRYTPGIAAADGCGVTATVWPRLALVLALLGLLLGGGLPGCGFQLRGAVDIPSDLSPVHVRGGGLVARSIEGRLASSGVPSAQQPADAGLIIDILAEQRDSRVVAVDQDGKALAYMLTYRVRFAAVDGAGRTVIEPQTLALDRTFDDNPDVAVLGKELESDIIYVDMTDDAADQVILRLRAALRQRAGAAT